MGLRNTWAISFYLNSCKSAMLSVMNSMPSTLGLLILVIVIGVIIIIPLWIRGYFQVVGPIIGALISIIAVLGNETAKYYSSTSTLKLSLGLGNEKNSEITDPGLDVEVFKDPPDYRRYRVSAMVINDGKAIIRDVKASLTIRVKKKGYREIYYIGDVLIRRNDFSKYQGIPCINEMLNSPDCKNFLVNEYNPHVIGEALAWALPELRTLTQTPTGGYYQHVTSISPKQRSRLLIFEYERLSDGGYLVMPFSEYGTTGPYRACLRLDKDHEFIFGVTVHGEGARSPLQFKLCIDSEKLANIENAIGDFEKLLKALNNLKCEN